MDDDGHLRSPKWIRAHDAETRTKWAKVSPLFQGYMGDKLPPELDEWWCDWAKGPNLLALQTVRGMGNVKAAASLVPLFIHKGMSVRWISSEDYVEMYKEEWDEASDDNQRYRTLKYIQRGFDVLVLDGLGEEPNTTFEKKVLGSLIKKRYELGLTTIIVTPYNQMELASYGSRVGSYLNEGTHIKLGR